MSLRIRISLLLLGFTTFVVLVAGAVVHQLFQNDLYDGLDDKLTWHLREVSEPDVVGKILTIQRFFAIGRDSTGVERLLSGVLDPQIPTRILVGDDTVIATSGFPDLPMGTVLSQETKAVLFSNFRVDEQNWRVATSISIVPSGPAALGTLYPGAPTVIIQSATTTDTTDAALQDFRGRLVIGGIFAILAAGLGGWVLGSTVLHPLNRLRTSTERVRNSKDLSQRVPEKLGPSEVEILAKSLNEMLSRLEMNVEMTEQALASSRAFASNVAHEIRTSLTSIRMNLDLLARYKGMEPNEKSEVLENIINEQDRLLSMFESLRLLARGDLSEDDVFEEVDLAELIAEIVDRQRKQLSDVKIQVDLPALPPLIIGWREGLTVLLRNLIENASVHGRVAGRPLIIDIFVQILGDNVRLEVSDNGPGIPIEERDKVMDRFTRGSESQGSGSGLGLSLVKQQAELHGGSVMLTDSPLNGNCVSITLPVIS